MHLKLFFFNQTRFSSCSAVVIRMRACWMDPSIVAGLFSPPPPSQKFPKFTCLLSFCCGENQNFGTWFLFYFTLLYSLHLNTFFLAGWTVLPLCKWSHTWRPWRAVAGPSCASSTSPVLDFLRCSMTSVFWSGAELFSMALLKTWYLFSSQLGFAVPTITIELTLVSEKSNEKKPKKLQIECDSQR